MTVSDATPEQRERVRVAALDPIAVAARARALDVLPTPFAFLGQVSQLAGHLIGPDRQRGTGTGNGDDAVVAIGWVMQCAHDLLAGVKALLDIDNLYGASALIRQLVEVEYLAWASAAATEDVAEWLRSTPEDRRARWQPRHLRQRSAGRFDLADYSQHCELGGHPTPAGIRALVGSHGDHRDAVRQIATWEAVNHGYRIWGHCMTNPHIDLNKPAADQPWFPSVRAAFEQWRAADHLSEATRSV